MSTWVCVGCDYRESAPEAPALCPSCGLLEGFEEVTSRETPATRDVEEPLTLPTLADATHVRPIEVVRTGHPVVDRLTNGVGVGVTTLLYGHPGQGKSWLGLTVASGVLRGDERGLVVCPEMTLQVLKDNAQKAGVRLDRLHVLTNDDDELANWRRHATALRPRVLLVDSITKLEADALDWIRHQWPGRAHGIALVLAQISREGRPLGGTGVEHDPDAVFRLERGRRKGSSPILVVEKCRYGTNEPGFAPLRPELEKPARRKRSAKPEKRHHKDAAGKDHEAPPEKA